MAKITKKPTAPKIYKSNNFPYKLKDCPDYAGHVPENLGHEVCKYCGSINYYH